MIHYGEFGESVNAAILEQRRHGIEAISIVLSYNDFYNWIVYLCNTHIGVTSFSIAADVNNHTFQYMGKTIMWSYGVIDGQIKTVI